MRRSVPLVSAVALTAAVAGAGVSAAPAPPAAPPGHPLAVAAGFYPLAEWAAVVGGDRVAVRNLTPTGSDPHDVEPTPADVRRLREAQVVLTLGAGFQPAVDRSVARPRPGQVRFVATRALGLEEGAGHGGDTRGDEGGSSADPHVWLDPVLAARIVLGIAEALGQAEPSSRPAFEAAARAYAEKLSALDARYLQALATCARRELVTSHAAFGHLAARYGLEQEAIRGISPEAEPTPRRLADLVNLVKRRGVKYVFTETTVSPKVAETLAREAGAKTLVLHTLEALNDREIAQGKTYLSVMDENLRALATGLQCPG